MIDLSPEVQICALDQSSATVEGTSFALSLRSDKPGAWTVDGVVADPADGITVTKSWVVPEPDQRSAVFGVGFPVPPGSDTPAQVQAWKDRQSVPGAKLDGDPALSVVLLQLNRTTANPGKFTGLVLTYSDATGSHTQTAAGFAVTLNPPGTPC